MFGPEPYALAVYAAGVDLRRAGQLDLWTAGGLSLPIGMRAVLIAPPALDPVPAGVELKLTRRVSYALPVLTIGANGRPT